MYLGILAKKRVRPSKNQRLIRAETENVPGNCQTRVTAKWSLAARDWKAAMNQFAILYQDRFTRPQA